MEDADYLTVEVTITLASTASRVVPIEVVRDAWDAATEAQRAEMIQAHVMDFVSWDWVTVDKPRHLNGDHR